MTLDKMVLQLSPDMKKNERPTAERYVIFVTIMIDIRPRTFEPQ